MECTLPSPARDQDLKGNKELTPPSPPAQVPELQDTKGKRLSSPTAKDKDHQDTTGNMPPPPLVEDISLHPSTKQPELQPSTDRLPLAQQLIYEAPKDSSSSGFFVFRQKV
jgi:hypothetical protein